MWNLGFVFDLLLRETKKRKKLKLRGIRAKEERNFGEDMWQTWRSLNHKGQLGIELRGRKEEGSVRMGRFPCEARGEWRSVVPTDRALIYSVVGKDRRRS